MPQITIYTKPTCPFCQRAKQLLESKSVAFDEIDVADNPDRREEMAKMTGGRRSLPQIFIGDRHIGGCDDLLALDKKGKLDALLA